MKHWLYAALVISGALLHGCVDADTTTHIRMWHFWSEPAQRRVLDSLISVFESEHPGVDVELTELTWTDGTSKLQLAFNAGTQPDVVHLGLDWFADFDAGGVFDSLPADIATDGNAARWLVNVRALVGPNPTPTIGACAVSDAHNVIKRILPALWERGSTLYTRQPVSADLNSGLVSAFLRLHRDAPNLVLDRSRQLDELLLRGNVSGVFTGPWIVDMARQRGVTLHTTVMPSILNADVLAISRTSQHRDLSIALIRFLTQYDHARAFCERISDAGFPADLARAQSDTLFMRDPLMRGFLATALQSRTLPRSATLLRIEPVIEEMISRACMTKDSSALSALVASTRARVLREESR